MSTTTSSPLLINDYQPPARSVWRTLRSSFAHRGFAIGAVLLLVIMLGALFAPWLAPYDPYAQDVMLRMKPPVWMANGTWDYVLGTDKLGRDYLSRLLYGARISLFIGFSAALISGIIGTIMGLLAGYFGGKTDALISYLITTRLAMPVVMIALASASLIGGSLKVVIVLLGCLLWDRFAVVVRAAVQQIRDAEYVASAQALGCSTLRILASEILPNLVGALIVVATLEMAHAILLESALWNSRVQPPIPSWGLMIAEGKPYMFFSPWVIAIPGVALMVLVLGINLVGDGLRDLILPDGRN
ncbi:ABC transporter permease [Pseudomonas syringae]|uniref:ABC transporter permease n=1 Tax=Pseudomonas syringae TaxID=317 RepID=UPI003D805975